MLGDTGTRRVVGSEGEGDAAEADRVDGRVGRRKLYEAESLAQACELFVSCERVLRA